MRLIYNGRPKCDLFIVVDYYKYIVYLYHYTNIMNNQIIYFANQKTKSNISRYAKDWKIKKIYKWIYIKAWQNEDSVISMNFTSIAYYIFWMCVLAWPTALKFAPVNNTYFFRSDKSRTVKVWKYTFVCSQLLRLPTQTYYQQFSNVQVFAPIKELALLEGCYEYEKHSTLSKKDIAQYIAKQKDKLNYGIIDKIIALNKNNIHLLSAKNTFAEIYWRLVWSRIADKHDVYSHIISMGHGIQKQTMENIDKMAQACLSFKGSYLPNTQFSQENILNNYCFWESYYSNYIEWTIFDISDAEKIITTEELWDRPNDSHDILSHYKLTRKLYSSIHNGKVKVAFNNADEFINFIKWINKSLNENTMKTAWQFKKVANRVWNYVFTQPENAEGTLRYAFHYFAKMNIVQQAMFVHFVITEVHPFDDGNGRTARMSMNSLLIYAKKHPIIISHKYRDEYMWAVTRASQYFHHDNYLITLEQAQNRTAHFDFNIDIESHDLRKEAEENEDKTTGSILDSIAQLDNL